MSLPRPLLIYVIGVCALALACSFLLLSSLPPGCGLDLAIFVVLAAVAEYWVVPTGSSPIEGEVTTSFAVIYAAALLFGPEFAVLVAVSATVLVHGIVRHRVGLLGTLFNAAQLALAAAACGLAFAAVGGHRPLSVSADGLAMCVAALAYLAVNASLPTVFLLLWKRQIRHLPGLIRQEGLFFVAMAPIGVLLALSYQQSRWSVLLVPFLLIVIYKGFALYASLKTETNNALVALADAVDKRDPHTFQHSLRVARYVEKTARQLGLSAWETEVIVSAARIHDLGKLSTDNRILFKEGALTEQERAEIREHPDDGAVLAAQFSMYGRGRDFIRHHHERWDGTGYPDGLAGEAIPLGARIIAVADAFDAMTSDRPYRQALSHEVAIEELWRGRGSQFDERVVDAFLASQSVAAPARAAQATQPVGVQ